MDKLGRMKTHKLLLLAVACTWAMGAAAQWQWIDKDGRKVFSDRPPPQEIPEKSILKQPGGGRPRAALPAPAAPLSEGAPTAAEGATAAASAPKPAASAAGAGKDKALEEKKAQAEAAEAAKKKAEEEKLAKAKAENCTRARQAKASFETGRPITQSNAQGERVFLDEAGRAAEIKRIDGVIAADCKR
jgi:type IV secretory pathway VirB10-like protein